MKYNKDAGFRISGATRNTITENTVEENISIGIFLHNYFYPTETLEEEEEEEYNLIEDNTIHNNSNAGISDGGSRGLQILDNQITKNRDGIITRAIEAEIQGNFIGVSSTGEKLGNHETGVILEGESTLVTENTIAHNGTPPNPNGETSSEKRGFGSGIEIRGAAANTISKNKIFGNVGASSGEDYFSQGLGIDFGGDGPTPNDPQDFLGGQNYPVLMTLSGGGGVSVFFEQHTEREVQNRVLFQ